MLIGISFDVGLGPNAFWLPVLKTLELAQCTLKLWELHRIPTKSLTQDSIADCTGSGIISFGSICPPRGKRPIFGKIFPGEAVTKSSGQPSGPATSSSCSPPNTSLRSSSGSPGAPANRPRPLAPLLPLPAGRCCTPRPGRRRGLGLELWPRPVQLPNVLGVEPKPAPAPAP